MYNDMAKILIVRGAKQDENNHLTDYDRKAIESITEKIKPRVDGKKFVIMAGQLPGVAESAKIMGEILKSKVKYDGALGEISKGLMGYEKVIKMIKQSSKKTEVIVIVTGFHGCNHLPDYIARELFHVHAASNYRNISAGSMWVMNCEIINSRIEMDTVFHWTDL